jgi:hypothetical protein
MPVLPHLYTGKCLNGRMATEAARREGEEPQEEEEKTALTPTGLIEGWSPPQVS